MWLQPDGLVYMEGLMDNTIASKLWVLEEDYKDILLIWGTWYSCLFIL